MKKSNGFTLIELLAVIVILAVLSLIATPIILNVIDKAKIGVAESSALGYVEAVENQVITNKLKNANLINSGIYDKGELTNRGVKVKNENSITTLRIMINSKGVIVEGKFCIDGKSIKYDGKNAKYNKNENYCSEEISLNGIIAPKAKSLAYTGSAQELIEEGTTIAGEIQYRLNSGSYSTSIPSATNAGTYTVYYKVVDNNNIIIESSIDVTIEKGNNTIRLSSNSGEATYPNSIEFTVEENASNGELSCASSDTESATCSISGNKVTVTPGVKASNYTVITVKTAETENYKEGQVSYVVISNNGVLSYTANDVNTTYDGTGHGITVTSSGSTIKYGEIEGTYNLESSPTYINVGTYTVYYEISKVGYTTVRESKTVTINKATGSVIAPTAKTLTYTGSAQALINAGSSTTGTIQYKLNSGSYSTSIPSATNAGTYTVYYKVVGDSNHNDVAEKSISVGIAEPFAGDSWATIAAKVKSGNYPYKVGDTKCVHLNGFSTTNANGCNGDFLVRVANKSKCTNGETSETACGFVVEFVDIIEKRVMNSSSTNVGGWRDSAMRTYVNGTIYNALPSDLRNVIADTKVVSGHGPTSGETNFTTTDKLYLLSAHEVWSDGTSDPVSTRDTSYNNTRQLDYYANLGVTTNNYAGAIKKYNGSNDDWWLRSAYSNYTNFFLFVNYYGDWSSGTAANTYGVSAAFRIS